MNHYNKYIEKRAEKLRPLYDLLKKKEKNKFKRTEEHENALNNVKKCLMSKPILAIFDEKKEVIIETDGSVEFYSKEKNLVFGKTKVRQWSGGKSRWYTEYKFKYK